MAFGKKLSGFAVEQQEMDCDIAKRKSAMPHQVPLAGGGDGAFTLVGRVRPANGPEALLFLGNKVNVKFVQEKISEKWSE